MSSQLVFFDPIIAWNSYFYFPRYRRVCLEPMCHWGNMCRRCWYVSMWMSKGSNRALVWAIDRGATSTELLLQGRFIRSLVRVERALQCVLMYRWENNLHANWLWLNRMLQIWYVWPGTGVLLTRYTIQHQLRLRHMHRAFLLSARRSLQQSTDGWKMRYRTESWEHGQNQSPIQSWPDQPVERGNHLVHLITTLTNVY